MIYEYPDQSAPIRQGDIFLRLPRIDISLATVPVVKDTEQVVMHWEDIAEEGVPVTALLGVKPVSAIVVNQDCDNQHSTDITLCEIRPFRDVERKSKEANSPKAWMSLVTQQARMNLKWFYLPPDERLGFTEKMGADFLVTLRVLRTDLESLRNLRKARLNDLSDEHFRERLAEFYRRYPYDEWYPLSQEEFQAYAAKYPGTAPFPWQRT